MKILIFEHAIDCLNKLIQSCSSYQLYFYKQATIQNIKLNSHWIVINTHKNCIFSCTSVSCGSFHYFKTQVVVYSGFRFDICPNLKLTHSMRIVRPLFYHCTSTLTTVVGKISQKELSGGLQYKKECKQEWKALHKICKRRVLTN